MGLSDVSLDQELPALRQSLVRYPFTIETFIPDRVLFNFAIDVAEHSIAVSILRTSEAPRAAYANARAAMEAAQDLIYLTQDPVKYELRGCHARCAELLENLDIQRRANAANDALGVELLPHQDPEAVLIQDADEWDALVPGKGKLLRTAFEAVQAEPDRRKHWSGYGRRDLAYAIERESPGEKGFAIVWNVLYGAVSAHAHPRPRSSQRDVHDHDDGGILLAGKPEDSEIPEAVAAWSCHAARSSLGRRRAFGSDAT